MIILFFGLFFFFMIVFFFISSSLLFSSLLSSLSSLLSLFSCLVSPLTCLFFFFSFLLLFSLLLSPSPLFFFFFFFSLSSSLFLSLSLSPCVGGVCRRVCLCVVWCGVCRVVWHAENPVCRLTTLSVCRFKTSTCMPATRAHAFQHVGRGASTHGDVLNLHTESVLSLHTAVIASSAYQNLPTYGYHVLQRFTKKTFRSFHVQVRGKDREQHVPDSSNHSLYLIKL